MPNTAHSKAEISKLSVAEVPCLLGLKMRYRRWKGGSRTKMTGLLKKMLVESSVSRRRKSVKAERFEATPGYESRLYL